MSKFTDDDLFEIHRRLFPNGNPPHIMSNETKIMFEHLNEKLEDLKETSAQKDLIEEKHLQIVSKLDEIHLQTQKTNGRVSRLEKWRSYMTGAIAMLVAVYTVLQGILPLLKK